MCKNEFKDFELGHACLQGIYLVVLVLMITCMCGDLWSLKTMYCKYCICDNVNSLSQLFEYHTVWLNPTFYGLTKSLAEQDSVSVIK